MMTKFNFEIQNTKNCEKMTLIEESTGHLTFISFA